mmetsp:Transcript_11215/g.12620  ORF Transcript_11215/g.12620 Transcript_11215/m.12620 type:complete len:89 (-) Transcript_11215:48-314(-)
MCRTQLGTVHTPYPWRGNSYSSSIGERRGRCSGIIIIRMGPIGLYIIHSTRHTILIATRHHHQHHHSKANTTTDNTDDDTDNNTDDDN